MLTTLDDLVVVDTKAISQKSHFSPALWYPVELLP